jgi:Mg2+-importing ATPase
MDFFQYTIKDIKEVLAILESDEAGLSEEDAQKRQKVFGLNEIKTKETTLFDIFIRQFKSPFFYLLFLAAIFSILVGEIINGLVILAFVVINVILGFFQETKVLKTVSLLKEYIPFTARVLRDGNEKIIDRKFLVPGDIILVEVGDIIPADIRIKKAKNFLVDESVLTGESFPVAKIIEKLEREAKEIFDAKNLAFTGTTVVSGEAEGVVVETGTKTIFGRVTKIAAETTRQGSYEKELYQFSSAVLKLVIGTILLISLAKIFITGTINLVDTIVFYLALVVTIIPEALPVVVTFALSRGAMKLAKEKVIVKRLSAIEDLGNIEILCTDKTGTLTENRLSLEKIVSDDKEKCLFYGLLASSFSRERYNVLENPFDQALFTKTSPKTIEMISKFKVISEIPFEPNKLRNSVFLENEKKERILIVRGAPEVILELSSKIEGRKRKNEIQAGIKIESIGGKRVLGVAYKILKKSDYFEKDEKNLTFLGYFSFTDPLKKTAKSAIELSKMLGIRVKILTGDAYQVAGVVAREVGLVSSVKEAILGKDLELLPKEEFAKACEEFNVFARVSPETKLKIIKTLQEKYEVGYIGEGINDIPSLKAADVGIAVKEATDAAREASDIILLKKDLSVIVDGIKEGRHIFSNIQKYIQTALSTNFGNFYSIAFLSIFLPFFPILPAQILLDNLLSDFPFIGIATDNVDIEELRKPKCYRFRQLLFLIILLALVSNIFDFIFFGIFYRVQVSTIQTLWFMESLLTEIFIIFSIRTQRFFLKSKKPSNILILFSLLVFLITIILPFTNFGKEFFGFISPSISSLLIVLGLSIIYFFASELVKVKYYQHQLKNQNN